MYLVNNKKSSHNVNLCLCGRVGTDAETIIANDIGFPPPIQYTNVRCIGFERSITECQMLEDWDIRCTSRKRVGVNCVKRPCSNGIDLKSRHTIAITFKGYFCNFNKEKNVWIILVETN